MPYPAMEPCTIWHDCKLLPLSWQRLQDQLKVTSNRWISLTDQTESVHLGASSLRPDTENVESLHMTPCPTISINFLHPTSIPAEKTLTLRPPNHHRESRLLRWSPALGRNCTPMCNLALLSLQEWHTKTTVLQPIFRTRQSTASG